MSWSDKDKEPTVLSTLLRRIRLEAGFTQQNIAQVLEIDRSTYVYYELGRVAPDFVTLNRLAKIYNVPLETFLPDKGENDEQKE